MGPLSIILGIFFPRLVLVCLWLFTTVPDRAFQGVLFPGARVLFPALHHPRLRVRDGDQRQRQRLLPRDRRHRRALRPAPPTASPRRNSAAAARARALRRNDHFPLLPYRVPSARLSADQIHRT